MESYVFLAVLLAAAMHAGWNALLKLDVEPLRAITLISIAAGMPAVVLEGSGALQERVTETGAGIVSRARDGEQLAVELRTCLKKGQALCQRTHR